MDNITTAIAILMSNREFNNSTIEVDDEGVTLVHPLMTARVKHETLSLLEEAIRTETITDQEIAHLDEMIATHNAKLADTQDYMP